MLLNLSKLYDKTINELLEPHIENIITSFEEIISVNTCHLKSLLLIFEVEDIVKTSMGASPTVNSLLKICLLILILIARELSLVA